jgi:hypothetical protein
MREASDYTQYVSRCAENAGIVCEFFGVMLPLEVKKKNGERASIVVKGAVVEGMTGSRDKKRTKT